MSSSKKVPSESPKKNPPILRKPWSSGTLKVIADENIPFVREAFEALGDVVVMSGRAMSAEMVKKADLLLVRSITRVNRALLEGSAVRFVATATIGDDHIDKAYLAERGIGFASAPGCNANSVAEYIAATLLELAFRGQRKQGQSRPGDSLGTVPVFLAGKTLGIVGVGNVGKRVLAKAPALGLECVLNDPPLARETGDPKYRPIEEIFDCDIVTLHVPLAEEGPDATYHLANETFIRNMKPGAVLINTARGAVADGAAVKHALDDGHLRACVLDVWEGEPNPDPALLERAFIGTPHIAGYSFDGKVNGTRQIYEAACRFLGHTPAWDPTPLLPEPENPELTVRGDIEDAVRTAVQAVYDVMADDAGMRAMLGVPEHERGAFFDRLRKQYPRRREFFNTRVAVQPPNVELEAQLRVLGFQCSF